MKKPLRLGLEIAVALVLLWAFMLWQQRHLIPTDQIAPPAVELPTLSGDIAPLYQANQRTLVYFFAPWCSICKISMPNLQAIQHEVAVVAVALDYQNVTEVEQFIAGMTLDVPVLLGNTEIRSAFNISAYPTYYLIDAQGRVEAQSLGYSTELGLRFRVAE